MKALLFALLPLILPASTAFGQTFSGTRPGQPLTLSWPQQVRVATYVDSLQQVAEASRTKAAQWQRAAGSYRVAADSLLVVAAEGRVLRANEQALTRKWQVRARRRGLLNWIGAAVAGGAVCLLLTH